MNVPARPNQWEGGSLGEPVDRNGIAKSANNSTRCVRKAWEFPNARSAFKELLKRCCAGSRRTALLPSYIGLSSREGSGVFDPVKELALTAQFYRVSRDLRVDVTDFERCVRENDFGVVLLIHYFGFVDPAYEHLVDVARKSGAFVIEDEAHAMLTDLVCGGSGRLGDACLFSLHKMLPLRGGGLLLVNSSAEHLDISTHDCQQFGLRDFDLWSIARIRRANAEYLANSIDEFKGELSPLFATFPPNIVPQSYPVILQHDCRDEVYHRMNARGFGVISLYHTLINEVKHPRFADSQWLSQHILNLPVHQDVSTKALDLLIQNLRAVLKDLS